MVFKVYEERAEQAKPEREVFLRLRDDGDGEVTVIACDKNGERIACGSICCFKRSGTLFLNSSISNDLGFVLDDSGKIKVE